MNSIFKSSYSLKKSKNILRHNYHLFLKKRKKLPVEKQEEIKHALLSLQQHILNKDKASAETSAKEVELLSNLYLKKTSFDHVKDLVFALLFALTIALLVRQMWFEFYEIPSGSMRPTFKEQDRLVVSKTTFGINVPLEPKQFYFDPTLVKNNGIVIFTGENMDIRDVDTMYFYLFPGKKQYIKRMIGKPGDVLYFYGGRIYGIDADGKDISPSLQLASLDQIEHIPFIDFDRKLSIPSSPSQGIFSPVTIYQMNEPIAKLYMNSIHQVAGEMLNPPQVHSAGAPKVTTYSDLWGFRNFGMCRLLTKDQVKALTDQDVTTLEEGVLYLEIRHNPSLASAKLVRDEMGRLRPSLGISTSVIPLQQHHLQAIFDHLYTARFEVKNGFAFRWGSSVNIQDKNVFLPHLHNIPNGCYEFYYGKAYEVKWQGMTTELPPSHPLYSFDAQRLQTLYNLGMEFDLRFAPQIKGQRLMPSRYAYYREGDLYLMGAPILKKDDPALVNFLKKEEMRQVANTNYQPFMDHGAPLQTDGSLDIEFVRQFGIMVPPHGYLVLGDNHAMSGDSREFGFVPENNLRGAPDFIFSPPGPRFGFPNQPAYPWINFPRTIVWILAAIGIGISTIYWRSRNKLPLKHL